MNLQSPTFQEQRLNDELPMVLMQQHADGHASQPGRTGQTGKGKHVHFHPEGQMYISLRGLIVLEVDGNRSVLPPGRIGWVPPRMPHAAAVHGSKLPDGLVGYTIHFTPSLCTRLPQEAVVLRTPPLAQALLDRMRAWPQGIPEDEAALRLMHVFLDEISAAEPDPLHLTMPRHPRLLAMAAAIADNPADETDLDSWALKTGLSRRSITRRFRDETGMSLVEWRQIVRLQRGMELLTAGQTVTNVAVDLGYDSVSSFIALFRRTLGTTPAKFAQMASVT